MSSARWWAIPTLQSNRLKYQQVKNYVLQQIADGHLRPGDALPPERTLARTLGWGVHTIRHALSELKHEEIVHRVQGKGTFVKREQQTGGRKKKLDIFALVVPETRESFYPSLLHGFEDAARQIHHQTLICATEDDVERQANIILQLIDKKVGGVAINPTSPAVTPAFQVRQLQDRGIPVVFCHRGVEGVAAPLLALPYRNIGRLAGKALVEHGHRRVAFFTGQPSPMVPVYEGVLQEVLREEGINIPVESVYLQDRPIKLREESCWTALQQMFARPDPPTAIFSSYDSVVEMIYLQLPRLGLRVPEDVSLLGFGGACREGPLTQRLTSVVVDEIATGQKAVELLSEMRHGERAIDDDEEFVMELSLSDGVTLAAPVGVMA